MELPNLHSSEVTALKNIYITLWGMTCFPIYSPFPTCYVTSLLLLSYFFHEKYSDNLHSLVPKSKTCLPTFTGLSHAHSLHMPMVRRAFHFKRLFPRITTCFNLKILRSSILGISSYLSTISHTSYSLLLTSHTSFNGTWALYYMNISKEKYIVRKICLF